MLPEYLAYWGFQRSPFSLSPDPAMLFLSSQHQEALARLKYGVISNKGGVLLVSENAGDGKTSLLRRLEEDLRAEYEGRLKIAFVDHPTLTVNQMIAEIARQLGVARVRKEKIDNLNALRAKLLALHEAGTKALVMVDEGQMLANRPDILQELRILLNFCVSETFLLSFVFSGQKPLEEAVRRMPEFWQRLPVRYFLRNLDARDTAGLVRHRVRTAGQTEREVFTPTALEGVFRASQGCPRVICAVADLALLIGHSLRSPAVDFSEVAQATADMTRTGELYHYYSFLNTPARKRSPRRRCPACRRFVGAADPVCKRCGATLPEATPEPAAAEAPPRAPQRPTCPACEALLSEGPRCGACGLVLAQSCPRCQQLNPMERETCGGCGWRLSSREVLATREFEQGLRRLGLEPPPAELHQRFPVLKGEGRVLLCSLAPRLRLPWFTRSQLESLDKVLEGSFFATERAFVFANGASSRTIPYGEIRRLLVGASEKNGRGRLARLRIVLAQEELRLAFPVPTDKTGELGSLVSAFVANKRFAPPAPAPSDPPAAAP